MTTRCLRLLFLGIGVWHSLAAGTGRAGPYETSVVMTGLSSPRGLAFGPDGGLYVAEAGRGATAPVLFWAIVTRPFSAQPAP
jgi:hypothetical protein